MKYVFYEFEGAYFRRSADDPGAGIREVMHGGKWVPYEGDDMMEPVVYGNRIDESEIEPSGAPA